MLPVDMTTHPYDATYDFYYVRPKNIMSISTNDFSLIVLFEGSGSSNRTIYSETKVVEEEY